MANEVKLKITATDDASDEIKKVNKELDKLGDTAEDTGKQLDDSVGRIDKLMQLDAIKQFGTAAANAFGKVKDAMTDMVNEYMDYVEQVEDLTRLTGIEEENASRLIQIADDVRISYDTMSGAMQAATRQGVDVSVEGLMKLSDQYLSMQPGLERSEWLLHTFGRSGAEMGQLLEVGSQGIKEMSDAVADNLIVTAQNKQDVIDAKLAYDNFNDSVMGIKYSIVSELIPAFNGLPKPIQDTASALIAFGPEIAGSISTIADLTIALQGLGTLFKSGGLLAGAGAMLTKIKVAAVGLGIAIGPVAALAAAIAGLLALLNSDFGQKGVTALKQLVVMWANLIYGQAGGQWAYNVTGLAGKAAGGSVTGGKSYLVGEQGMEIFTPSTSGTIIPNHQIAMAGGSGGAPSVVFNYNPTVSFASRSEAELVLKPMIEGIVRAKYGMR